MIPLYCSAEVTTRFEKIPDAGCQMPDKEFVALNCGGSIVIRHPTSGIVYKQAGTFAVMSWSLRVS